MRNNAFTNTNCFLIINSNKEFISFIVLKLLIK